jgi:hypothetical protein
MPEAIAVRKLMDKKELVEALGGKLKNWTIGELTRRGDMPVIRIPNMRRYLYDIDAVERWLDRLQQIPAENKLRVVSR